ncbi:MAG: Hsp70 family protein [Planctomycetales bacterium]|nr:Hsp70 family protein [Planctomycetales bacterium]
MANGGRRSLVGIDLGTTQSVIAHLDATGIVSTIPNREGDMLTASAIYLDGNQALVGNAAKQAASHTPDKVATFIKRDMGRALYSRAVDGRQFRPETLSAIILRKLKQDAERRIPPIGKAVITVPAYFDDARRKATEDAARIAGFDSIEIINEPTAAAIAYCLEAQLNRDGSMDKPDFPDGKLTALVYDLGGGTFDVTAIRLESKRIDTLATDGAVKLGGKDWDDRIVQYVVRQFAERYGVKIPEDRQQAIANHAESTKKLLTDLPSAPVECFYQDHALRLTLTRAEFEEMTRDLIVQTDVITNSVVSKSVFQGQQLGWKDFNRVLLVGGSTRMPMVKKTLQQISGKEPDDSPDPDQVVARGAAIFAAIKAARGIESDLTVEDSLQQELQDIDVIDVNAHSLGIAVKHPKTKEPMTAVLIPKNRQLPFAMSKVFHLTEQGATAVRVQVLEGEAPDPFSNILLGEVRVTGLPPNLPKRAPVQVRLAYNPNGRVSVMALDMTGGRFAHAEIERKSGLTDADIEREAEFVRSLKIQ